MLKARSRVAAKARHETLHRAILGMPHSRNIPSGAIHSKEKPMGILGLTHDESGVALERLPVAIKVAIGEAPEPGNQDSHPKRVDHFVFKRKTLRGQEVVWEPAPCVGSA
jgi:hypothetical protein